MQQAPQQQPYQSQQQQDSPFSYPQQPAAKKQKKGGSLNPPVSRGGGGGGGGSKPTPLSVPGTGKQKSRSVPSTPQGGAATPAGGGLPGSAGPGARSGKGAAWRPLGVSAASFARVMQKGAPDEMEAYLGVSGAVGSARLGDVPSWRRTPLLARRHHRHHYAAAAQELNSREREIFTELIAQGVDEDSPELNELHRWGPRHQVVAAALLHPSFEGSAERNAERAGGNIAHVSRVQGAAAVVQAGPEAAGAGAAAVGGGVLSDTCGIPLCLRVWCLPVLHLVCCNVPAACAMMSDAHYLARQLCSLMTQWDRGHVLRTHCRE